MDGAEKISMALPRTTFGGRRREQIERGRGEKVEGKKSIKRKDKGFAPLPPLQGGPA